MRIGLVGNGYWARVTHAAGLSAEQSVTFAGLWGRDPVKSTAVASEFGVTAYASYDELLDDIDAVAFSVPPQVQSELALQAARRGKQLLLEKPIAVSVASADSLADAVLQAGVASVVFFTSRFDPVHSSWLAGIAEQNGWEGGCGLWLGSAFGTDSPFDTPWRHDKGGLWDVGPHALALAIGALGPVQELTARAGKRDLVQLVLRHAGGAVSSYAVTIDAPAVVDRNTFTVWGSPGVFDTPRESPDPPVALAAAARELSLLFDAKSSEHPCDVRLGAEVVRLLAEAERQLTG
jgi:predicted dehydrogenase